MQLVRCTWRLLKLRRAHGALASEREKILQTGIECQPNRNVFASWVGYECRWYMPPFSWRCFHREALERRKRRRMPLTHDCITSNQLPKCIQWLEFKAKLFYFITPCFLSLSLFLFVIFLPFRRRRHFVFDCVQCITSNASDDFMKSLYCSACVFVKKKAAD